ncbi:hypothetical protein [Methylocapsa sp. S129]|uniref:hypothetical protein n=1 Tax=Methylocapsa sp. S129 TaxID=1641869 RepID=UPI00131C2BDD|nr:hypothetical protein [Methylocapsa sp. S129]
MRIFIRRLVFALLAFAGALAPAVAQSEPGKAVLHLSAVLGQASAPMQAGLHWRVFNERAEADGSHALVAESSTAQPSIGLTPGDYVIHLAFGLASATKRISMGDEDRTERLTLNAGALRIVGTRGDAPIDANRLSLAIYVPERNNPEAKLVYSKAKAGDILGLPEGAYHIVSTYLDSVGVGSLGVGRAGGGAPSNAVVTNSIVSADIKVPSGKVLDVTLRHRYATLTLKLVNTAGAEALANTNFTILTPGGDLIRELIGAFPSLVLAEGEYVVIARHDSKTYQSTFQVQSGLDRDVEVIAQ